MFRAITLSIITAFFSLSAQAVSIDPANCGGTLSCWTTTDNSNLGTWGAIESAFNIATDPDMTLYYKDEVDDVDDQGNVTKSGAESGPFASSYTTTFSNTEFSPKDADIAYDNVPSISCPECYLLVKDGAATPAQYLISLSDWNGTETLELRNFWPSADGSTGGISHVEIWGNISPVPVPAAAWLFGTALIGFIGFSRRTKV